MGDAKMKKEKPAVPSRGKREPGKKAFKAKKDAQSRHMEDRISYYESRGLKLG